MGVRDAPGSEKPGVDRQEEEGGEQDEVNPALQLCGPARDDGEDADDHCPHPQKRLGLRYDRSELTTPIASRPRTARDDLNRSRQ